MEDSRHHRDGIDAESTAIATNDAETVEKMVLPPSSSSLVPNAWLLVAVSLSGAALLVWWALAFHPDNRQLWMVPFSLVLIGTPVVIFFSSVLGSDFVGGGGLESVLSFKDVKVAPASSDPEIK